ncbi:MAG: hypothetical protein RMJ43_00710 [Chloroherpetonaceae bacterium]|nr:DUF2092 domain-containing protein [Chthonomonadaceae bacterium]MDW8206330.1 hypothetical protein [Chloroherpetonaceae bacterium]
MYARNILKWSVCLSVLLVVALSVAGSAPGRADAKGERLLREAFRKLGGARAMTALITARIEIEGLQEAILLKGTVAALKPNYLRVELRGDLPSRGPIEFIYVADGKHYYSFSSLENAYTKVRLDPNPTEFLGQWEGEIDAFFGGEKNAAKVKATYAGSERVGNRMCEVVRADMEVKGPDGAPLKRTITYYIGKNDLLIHQAKFSVGEQTQTNQLTNIRLDAKKEKEDFVYVPPRDAREKTPPPPPPTRAEGLLFRTQRPFFLAIK